MAKPKSTTTTNIRVPNALYDEISTLAGEGEWALNSEIVAALAFWAVVPDTVRETRRAVTREELAAGGQRTNRIPSKAGTELNGREYGTLTEQMQRMEGQIVALKEALSRN